MTALPRLPVPIYYDFASSLCYVAHRVFQRLEHDLDELGVELVWTPLDLAGLLNWRRGGPVAEPRRDNASRVARELGVRVRVPTHWLDSRRAMAIALCMGTPELAASWRERVFTAVFEQGIWEALPERALRLASEHGVECSSAELDAGLSQLEAHTFEAAEASVSGAPTLMLRGFPIGGIHEDATMLSILGRYARRARAEGAAQETRQ